MLKQNVFHFNGLGPASNTTH